MLCIARFESLDVDNRVVLRGHVVDLVVQQPLECEIWNIERLRDAPERAPERVR